MAVEARTVQLKTISMVSCREYYNLRTVILYKLTKQLFKCHRKEFIA